MAHRTLTVTHEGTPQSFALWKGGTKQYVVTKNLDPKVILIDIRLINLCLHPMLWRPISKIGNGDTLRNLPHTCGRHKSGQINISDIII
jgi:hypothetical protein